MVIEFGMSEKLGPVRYASPSMTYLAGASQIRDDTGDGTAIIIDGEIRKFVTEAQDTALKILKEHEKVLHEVSEVLQEKEVINHEEIEEIVKRHQEMENPSD